MNKKRKLETVDYINQLINNNNNINYKQVCIDIITHIQNRNLKWSNNILNDVFKKHCQSKKEQKQKHEQEQVVQCDVIPISTQRWIKELPESVFIHHILPFLITNIKLDIMTKVCKYWKELLLSSKAWHKSFLLTYKNHEQFNQINKTSFQHLKTLVVNNIDVLPSCRKLQGCFNNINQLIIDNQSNYNFSHKECQCRFINRKCIDCEYINYKININYNMFATLKELVITSYHIEKNLLIVPGNVFFNITHLTLECVHPMGLLSSGPKSLINLKYLKMCDMDAYRHGISSRVYATDILKLDYFSPNIITLELLYYRLIGIPIGFNNFSQLQNLNLCFCEGPDDTRFILPVTLKNLMLNHSSIMSMIENIDKVPNICIDTLQSEAIVAKNNMHCYHLTDIRDVQCIKGDQYIQFIQFRISNPTCPLADIIGFIQDCPQLDTIYFYFDLLNIDDTTFQRPGRFHIHKIQVDTIIINMPNNTFDINKITKHFEYKTVQCVYDAHIPDIFEYLNIRKIHRVDQFSTL